jgi:hypothetical protein
MQRNSSHRLVSFPLPLRPKSTAHGQMTRYKKSQLMHVRPRCIFLSPKYRMHTCIKLLLIGKILYFLGHVIAFTCGHVLLLPWSVRTVSTTTSATSTCQPPSPFASQFQPQTHPPHGILLPTFAPFPNSKSPRSKNPGRNKRKLGDKIP